MPYQFIHFEAVSKAGRDIYRNRNGKREKIGFTSIDSVLGEANREEGYIDHVKNPLPPVIIYGDKKNWIKTIRQKIKDWYDETKDARGHKVRVDANALLSGVVSWPPIGENEDEKEYYKKIASFEPDIINWFKKEYGEDLCYVIRHDDEPFHGLNAGKIHHHWHFYCVKKPGQKFDLHPGFLARSKYNLSRKDRENMSKKEKSKILNEGKHAYREAMVGFQDKFYQELGRFHGFERFGPKRIRRSRKEQKELERFVELEISEAEKIKKEAEKIKQMAKKEAEKITKKAEDKAEDIINGAWNTAKDITQTAEKEADSIIKKAKNFINQFLDRVNALPGGNKVVEWVKTFMISPKKTEVKKNMEKKGNDKQTSRSF